MNGKQFKSYWRTYGKAYRQFYGKMKKHEAAFLEHGRVSDRIYYTIYKKSVGDIRESAGRLLSGCPADLHNEVFGSAGGVWQALARIEEEVCEKYEK